MKKEIVHLLEQNPNSGFYAAEIASILKMNVHDVGPFLQSDPDFFFDEENKSYIGWRLSKYR